MDENILSAILLGTNAIMIVIIGRSSVDKVVEVAKNSKAAASMRIRSRSSKSTDGSGSSFGSLGSSIFSTFSFVRGRGGGGDGGGGTGSQRGEVPAHGGWTVSKTGSLMDLRIDEDEYEDEEEVRK